MKTRAALKTSRGPAMTKDLISGIVSSLLVVLFVEIYLHVRKLYRKRPLRRVIGDPLRCTVITPVHPTATDSNTVSLISTHSAYAMAHVLESYRSLGISTSFQSVRAMPDGLDGDVVAIGGEYVNTITRSALHHHFPGFTLFELSDERRLINELAFRCGELEFVDTEEQTWGFLARIAPDLTARRDSTFLIFGLGSVGTAAAAYFLSEFPGRLPGQYGKSFLIAIPVQRNLGYRGVSLSITDLGADASVALKPRAESQLPQLAQPGRPADTAMD